MGCIVQIILIIIAFAIYPILAIIWVVAQLTGALNDDYIVCN